MDRNRVESARLGSRALMGLTLVLALVVTGCGGGGGTVGEKPESAGTPKRGGTLVIGVISDFDAFSDFVGTDYETKEAVRQMLFMTLVQYDEDLKLQPYLAESWEVADDGLSMTYHIRKDVKWHDGTPTTAADVKFAYETAILPDVAYANVATFQYYKGAELLDPYTIRFTFTRPFAEQVENLALWPIMPKHLLEKVPPKEQRTAAFNRNPVGNGPFKFVRWKANEEIVFEANDEFSPSLGGRPYLDRVVFRVVPEQTTELSMLLTGELDLVRAVPPQDAERVEQSDIARLIVYPNRAYVYLAWNTRLPFFDTAKERTALTLGIDRQEIVDALLYGYGEVGTTHAFKTAWALEPSLKPHPYDPEQAKRLLAEEGWKDSDGDGVLDQGGKPFRFAMVTNKGNDLREDMLVMIKSHLAKIGVVAEPSLREWTVLLEETQRKEFEAWLSAWILDFTYDPRDMFHSEAIEGKFNMVSYSNPTADSLIDLGTSLTDREAAKPVWAAFQRLLHEEQPYTFLHTLEERVGVSRRVRGVDEIDSRSHIFGIRRWWLE